MAEKMAEQLNCPHKEISFTLPEERNQTYTFGPDDFVVIASPTYAGKLPNKILPDFKEKLKGDGSPAAALVTFGNRSFDNSLAELCAVLEASGFQTVAGGAFACRHAFTDKLAPGRPDEADLKELAILAERTADKLRNTDGIFSPVNVDGDADAPYYVPKGMDGQPAKFLKAVPKTHEELCIRCGACARLCPMGSIDPEEPGNVTGICIKCQSCIRGCPQQAKYFDDPAFLSHVPCWRRILRIRKKIINICNCFNIQWTDSLPGIFLAGISFGWKSLHILQKIGKSLSFFVGK